MRSRARASRWLRASAIASLLAIQVLDGCGGKDTPVNPKPGPGTHTFGAAVRYSSQGIRLGQVAIGDLNGDGRRDVAAIEGGGSSSRVLVYLQSTSGTLLDATPVTTSIGVRGIAIGDVNSDGRGDLLLSGLTLGPSIGYQGRLVIYRQDPGTGTLQAPVDKVVSSNSMGDLTVGDLNGDGRADVAVMSAWTNLSGLGNLSLYYQNSADSLDSELVYDKVGVRYTGEIQIADMNSDGRSDVVLQTGLLTFAVIVQEPNGALSETPQTYTVQNNYWPNFDALAVGDLNGDGKNDVVAVDPGNNGSLNLFFQSGGSLNGPVFPPPLGDATYGVEIADVNGDGLNDILGDVTEPGNPPNGEVRVFFQSAGHTFEGYSPFRFETLSGGGSAEHQCLAVGDVTGDGLVDAVMAWSDEGLWVLPGMIQH